MILRLLHRRLFPHGLSHPWGQPSFSGDHLQTWGKNMSWMHEPAFREAYELGFNSGHSFAKNDPSLSLEWRVHVILWAAQQALHCDGDFVECGVNTGIFSLAICKHLDFAKQPRKFFLFDTYQGIPEPQMSANERDHLTAHNAACYEDCHDLALRNFAPWPNAVLIRGMVPDTLASVSISKVAYLSLDMNIAKPERAALEYFWPKLSRGAPVVLDDYGWANFAEQKATMDEFAAQQGVPICCLPTGQGILIKP
ncbi:MAG: TylF/MycF/NovP-related O-methyltransferase [Verrucomicrobiaceae bacterium]